MDQNWKSQEVLMTVRDGVYLTPEQEARLRLAEDSHSRPDLRRTAASLLFALARRLDPETGAPSWAPEQTQGRPA
jgi:hypothetical protein